MTRMCFSSRRRHTRSCLVSWDRRCVKEKETDLRPPDLRQWVSSPNAGEKKHGRSETWHGKQNEALTKTISWSWSCSTTGAATSRCCLSRPCLPFSYSHLTLPPILLVLPSSLSSYFGTYYTTTCSIPHGRVVPLCNVGTSDGGDSRRSRSPSPVIGAKARSKSHRWRERSY